MGRTLRSDALGNKKRSCQPQQGNVMLKCYPKVLPTNSTIQKPVNPKVTSLIYSHLFRGKIKHAYQTCQANKSGLLTNSTTQKSVNPNVTSLIHSYLFQGKIKHAYSTCQANKSGLLKTCQQGLNMTGMTGKQTCQTINGARKQNM